MKQMQIDTMLDDNPLADRDRQTMTEALSSLDQLIQSGISTSGFSLNSPFERDRKNEPQLFVLRNRSGS